jgi:hypothetical protein
MISVHHNICVMSRWNCNSGASEGSGVQEESEAGISKGLGIDGAYNQRELAIFAAFVCHPNDG